MGIFPLETSRVCTGTCCSCCWVGLYLGCGDSRDFIFELEYRLWNLQQRPRYNWAQICIEKDHLFESTIIWVTWILGRTETRRPSLLVSQSSGCMTCDTWLEWHLQLLPLQTYLQRKERERWERHFSLAQLHILKVIYTIFT